MIWSIPRWTWSSRRLSVVSADSQRRGHAVEMLRNGLVAAAQGRYR
jgi:hypothetical protein